MIYLIGVEHGVQSVSVGAEESPEHRKFRECLEQAIQAFTPAIVAEEFSDDALGKYALVRQTPQKSFTKQIATTLNVEHIPCDTNLKTKLSLGYQGEYGWQLQLEGLWTRHDSTELELLAGALEVIKDFPLRENYWLEQLQPVLHEDILFVCGDYHIDTFGNRLKENGIQSQFVTRQIGMPAELIERTDRIREYIQTNRQHIEGVYLEILEQNAGHIPPLSVPGLS